MQFSLKAFTSLTLAELYAILQLRVAVFVVEQNCPYQDVDGMDEASLHLMLHDENNGALNAYARILPPQIKYNDAVAIGRVVSSSSVRNTGAGKLLMQEAINHCHRLYPNTPIRISAQLYLKAFYESLGFVQTSEMYLEDDIPHIEMLHK